MWIVLRGLEVIGGLTVLTLGYIVVGGLRYVRQQQAQGPGTPWQRALERGHGTARRDN